MPSVVGLPVIAPVAGFSVSPAGRPPPITAQAYGPLPPIAARLPLYGLSTAAVGSVVVATATWLRTVIGTPAFTIEAPLSVARTVKLVVPPATGVPVILQSALIVSPAGTLPVPSAQAY